MASGDGRYITIQQVKDQIPNEILAWATYGVDHPSIDPTAWTVDETKIANAISFAEGDVDSKISKRYKVPLDLESVTEEAARDIVIQAALLLAVHKLYDRIGHGDEVRSKLAQALTRLDSIASGAIELPGAESQARARIRYAAPKSTFSSNVNSNTDRVGNMED